MSLLERTNARYLKPGDLGSGISFVSMDVSFISATLVLPAVVTAVRGTPANAFEAVILVKPQFEAGREQVGKGGIVHDPAAHQFAIDRVRSAVQDLGAIAHRNHGLAHSWRRRAGARKGIANFFSTAAFKCFRPIAYTKSLHATCRHHFQAAEGRAGHPSPRARCLDAGA